MKYETAAAFRQALEQRFDELARAGRMPHVRSRKIVCFERFVARIQRGNPDRWLLKGGFALQLRFGRKSRTTLDVDLGASVALMEGQGFSLDAIRNELAGTAGQNLNDHFIYELGATSDLDLEAGPVRAFRIAVKASLASRRFEGFHVDAAVGDPIVATPVDLNPSGLLDFAGLPPLRLRAVAPVQHLAEKLHALTRPRTGSPNSRTRDLIDLMLLLDEGKLDRESVRHAVTSIFLARKTHDVPPELADPPESWRPTFAKLAKEIDLNQASLEEAMLRLRTFWKELGWQGK